ncbi:DUF7657 domain-containing protein [Aristaeella hokkaidonensis]|uniref:Uncharacterized protein n=1 Tax=Aristaeella hokkaidonensis TaxID=3046382 RepID=A0AC61N6G6_9FIRM|nr:hypothetical protein [Aristaeella hokkaidonensis]QUC66693.1 hypothetical protein JYE49_12680 [Aristaeella hokkaidonensis]SNT94667.1 4-amino-4-deoxy-L-arabinose transferase [Aristaeella hokkaidonensis]
MKLKRWVVLVTAFLLAVICAVGSELVMDHVLDREQTEETKNAVLQMFPGNTSTLVNCHYEDGYLIPENEDPQIVTVQTGERETANVTVRFGKELEENCFIQLFYDTGNGFNENETIKITANAGDEEIILPLPEGRYYNLRVDINGRVPLNSIDCDAKIKITGNIPGAFYKKRAAVLAVVFFVLFAIAALCLTDKKWGNGAKAIEDVVRYAILSVIICSFVNVYYRLGEARGLDDILRFALRPNWLVAVILFAVMFGSKIMAVKFGFNLFDKLHKWRWAIAAIVLVIAVALQLNGSSLHQWNTFIGEYTYNGVAFGVSRAIRSDEWARGTPMMKALSFENYPLYSHILRAAPTETVVTTAKATWDFSAVFHPFIWGYLLLGFTYGLSYSWCCRFILLFMLSYDMFMMMSGNRKLSFAFAVTIVLSPLVQWWFITPITELLVSCFGLTLAAKKYLTSQSIKIKLLSAFVVFILLGNYTLTLYPAWMVPLAYMLLGLIVWVIIDNRKGIRLRLKVDFPIIGGTILLFGAALAVIYLRSASAIHDMTNTVYPGTTRVNPLLKTGYLFSCLANILSPYTNAFVGNSNVCETAGMLTFFPLGILLGIYAMIRRRKADLLFILMMIVSGILALFTFADVPIWLRKITLMDMTMSYRIAPILDLVQVILLFRAVSMMQTEKRIKWYIALPVSALIAWLINEGLHKYNYVSGHELLYAGIFAGSLLLVFAAVYAGKNEKGRSLFATLMIIVSLFAGGTVNPVQVRADEIEKNTLISEIRKIVEEDPEGKWLVENLNYPYAMVPLMAGAPTINCANNYPNLALWYQLDPERENEYYYNRFAAQITTNLVEDEKSSFLSGATDDQFRLYLDIDDMHILDVSYMLSNQELERFSTEKVRIEKVYSWSTFMIYRVTYGNNA